jgi:hypothetical protein
MPILQGGMPQLVSEPRLSLGVHMTDDDLFLRCYDFVPTYVFSPLYLVALLWLSLVD